VKSSGQHEKLLDLGIGLQLRVLLVDGALHALEDLGMLDEHGRLGGQDALLAATWFSSRH